METAITSSTILASIICVVVITGVIKALNWVWLRPKKLEKWFRQQGLPGTSYKLLFGDLKDFTLLRSSAMEKPMASFSNDYFPRVEPLRDQFFKKFGRNYFMWAGPIPMVHIAKPELMREAFTKMQEFQKPKLNPIADKLFPALLSYEGEQWTKHRKLVSPSFHVEKLKLMLSAFYDSCAEMTDKWVKIVAETGSSEVDVWPYLTNLTADVISRAAFGSSYEEGQKIFELLKEQTIYALDMLQSVYIPGMRYIPTARNKRFNEVEDQIQTLLRGIVNKRKEKIESGEAVKGDLLGILLESNLKEIQQANGNTKNQQQLGLSLQEVIDECKLFYFAGQETTSVLLVWTLVLLSEHQDWQARAREEVFRTYGDKAPDHFEGLSHLKTISMILHEVLRLYPPAIYLARRINKDTKLGELSLPSGTLIAFSIFLLHREKEIWGEDAEEFKPERFSEGISQATRGNVSFFPFGWGPRICLGEKFALTEVKMALSMILQRFSFELSPSYAHAPRTVTFLQPQHGAQIILHKL